MRHHIVPLSEQVETDNRQVYLLPSQHGYAHWLYDQEHDTHTLGGFLSRLHLCKKDITCYEDFLPLDSQSWVSDEARRRSSEVNKGKHLSDEVIQNMIDARPNKKEVCQYSKEGHLIAEYESIHEAERQTGVSFKHISQCCLHMYGRKSAGGYYWGFKGEDFSIPQKGSRAKKIIQFTLDGEYVAEYPSALEAKRITKINNIIACCRGIQQTAGGYIWKYKEAV